MRKKKMKQKMAVMLCMTLAVSSVAAPSTTVLAAGVNETQSITLNVDSEETMYVGMSEKIKVKSVVPKNGSKKVTYESSDPEVVKITSSGTMKAMTEGEAVITVTSAANKEVSEEVEVNVKNLVKNKTYNKMVIPLDKKNKTRKLSRVSKVKASYLKITTSKRSVATVSNSGVIVGKKAGTAKITIKGKKSIVKGAKQVITVYVAKKSVESVELDKTSATLKPGDSIKLTTTVTPKNAANVVVFKTSDEDVATVAQNGKVTAVKEGTAEITATTVDGSKEAVCVVTVSNGTTEVKPGTTTETKTEATTGEKPGTTTEDKTEATTGENSGSTTENKTEATTGENSGSTTENKTEATTGEKPGTTTEDKTEATTGEKPGTTTEDKTEATTGDNSGNTTEDKTEATTEETTENPPEPERPVTPDNLTTQDMYEKVPYVSTYYFEPKPDYREDVVIPIYITDYEQSEYLKNDTTKTIDLLYEVDGVEHYLRNIKLGDMEVNLGKLTVGEHYFALQAIDRTTGLKSHKLYNDLIVVDPEKEKITAEQTYQITDEDLAKYGINKENSTVEDDMINTRDGLTNLFKEIQEKGYRKCILPQGTYRIKSTSRSESIYIPSYLTVDMNGSTFKLDTVLENNVGIMLVSFTDVEDAHLINGTLEGDRMERKALGLEYSYNGEPINTLSFNGGKYCSIDHLVIKNTTGHTVYTTGILRAGAGFTEYTHVRVVDGEEVSDESCSTTNYADLSKIKEISDYARVGQGHGYRGLRGSSPVIYVHFYDADKNFIKTETAYQYRNIRIPENAQYGRVTYLGTVDASDKYNSFYVKDFGDFNEITNIDFYDTRTTAMAPTTCSNLLIENVTYTRCGNSITPCSIDFEDGWQECQDVYYRNNTDCERPGTATVIDNTGFNHVYENLKGHVLVIRRSNMGCVVRNIDDIEGTGIRWATGNIMNSKFCRNYNNKISGCSVTHGDETLELSKHKVKNCVLANGSESSIDSVVYDFCTFTGFGGHKMVLKNCKINSTGYLGDQLYFYGCTFENPSEDAGEMNFSFNLQDATRVYEDCTFKGKTAFLCHNTFNSGLFRNCTFEDLRMRIGLFDMTDKARIEFDNCTIASSAAEFIHLGPHGYSRGYVNLNFKNCDIALTGENLIYSMGKATGESIIAFDNCTIDKNSGKLVAGYGRLADIPETSLNVIFKGGSINKELDTSWCNDTNLIRIKYE